MAETGNFTRCEAPISVRHPSTCGRPAAYLGLNHYGWSLPLCGACHARGVGRNLSDWKPVEAYVIRSWKTGEFYGIGFKFTENERDALTWTDKAEALRVCPKGANVEATNSEFSLD